MYSLLAAHKFLLGFVSPWILNLVRKSAYAKPRKKHAQVFARQICRVPMLGCTTLAAWTVFIISLIYLKLFICLELNSSAAWVDQGYHKNFKPFTDFRDCVERISIETSSPEEFIEKYEKPYIPVSSAQKLQLVIELCKPVLIFIKRWSFLMLKKDGWQTTNGPCRQVPVACLCWSNGFHSFHFTAEIGKKVSQSKV